MKTLLFAIGLFTAAPQSFYVVVVSTDGHQYAVPWLKRMSFEECDNAAKTLADEAAKAQAHPAGGTVACKLVTIGGEDS